MNCEHDFRKFDAERVFCRRCGTFSPSAPEPEWFDRFMEAIRAMPQPVCYHSVPYYPQPYPAWPWWTMTTTTARPFGDSVTVGYVTNSISVTDGVSS